MERRQGVVENGRVVVDGLSFADGELVDLTVLSHVEESPRPPKRTPEEWIAAFNEWGDGFAQRYPNMPVLSDEAMSRESIYEDRGL